MQEIWNNVRNWKGHIYKFEIDGDIIIRTRIPNMWYSDLTLFLLEEHKKQTSEIWVFTVDLFHILRWRKEEFPSRLLAT